MGDQKNASNATVLGADCEISGDLTLDNDAIIMGSFSGTLRVTGVLELTESARVSGTIIVGQLRHAGQAEADVVAENGVELLPGSSLNGQVYTNEIHVSPGAAYTGDLTVGPDAVASAGMEPNDSSTTDVSADQDMDVQVEIADDSEGMDDASEMRIDTNPQAVATMLRRRKPKVLRPAA